MNQVGATLGGIGFIVGAAKLTPSPDFARHEFETWQENAKVYHQYAGAITGQVNGEMLSSVGVASCIRHLDVACGTGELAALSYSRGADVIGVDFAPEMVTIAKSRHRGPQFQIADATALPFSENTFDALTCAFGLLHFADPDAAIAEMSRVMKPGGRLCAAVWSPPRPGSFFGFVLAIIREFGQTDIPELHELPPMFRFANTLECAQALAAHGFFAINVREVTLEWRPKDRSQILSYCYEGSARLPLLLARQNPKAREFIHAAILERSSRFERNGALLVPWPAGIISAMKRCDSAD